MEERVTCGCCGAVVDPSDAPYRWGHPYCRGCAEADGEDPDWACPRCGWRGRIGNAGQEQCSRCGLSAEVSA